MKPFLKILLSKMDLFVELGKSFVCGGISTVVDILVLTGLIELLHSNAHLAVIIGFLSGMIVNYVLNTIFVYSHCPVDCHWKAIRQFFLISLFTIVLGTALIFILTDYLKLHYLLSKLLVTGIVFLLSFVLRKKIVFTQR